MVSVAGFHDLISPESATIPRSRTKRRKQDGFPRGQTRLDHGAALHALDGLVHAIAFAPREAITGDFLEGLSREAFRIAHDVSSYSFAALARAALPLMQGRPAALVTLTYLGADRVVPGYNTMGLAKASLEAGVRYLAASLGPKGIRVNAVSAG